MAKYNNRILEMKKCHAPLATNGLTYNSRIVPVFSYVSQLVPLPKTFQERYGMFSVITAPQCVRTSDFYQLHKLGGPKFRSISVSCAAATFRTALTTVTSWPQWISQLEIYAKECLPVDQCLKGVISPTYWDTDPLAIHLKHAYNGFPNSTQWAEGGALLVTKLLAQHRNRPVLPGCESVKKKTGLQTIACDQLMSSDVNLDFTFYLKERLQDVFDLYVLDWDNIHFESSIAALNPSNTGDVMKIIKTLLNEWTTSSRVAGVHKFWVPWS